MAFSSLKPCSRLVRGSPHQTDQQQKEVYYLLQDHHEQQHQEEQVKDHQTKNDVDDSDSDSDSDATSWKALQCDEPPQLPSTASEPSYQEELPTFIAHQGFLPLKLQQNKDCKHMVDAAKSHVGSGNWFRKERSANGELLSTYSDRNCESQVYFHTALPPLDVPRRAHKFSFMRMDPKKQSTEQDHHNKQRPRFRKNACASSNIYGITSLDRAIPVREEVAGVEKRRNSSASVQDVIGLRKVVPNKGRCHVDGRSSSWEEEVRQAMARSLIGKKQDEGVHGLQRSTSVKEYGTATVPPTLSVKTTGGSSEFDLSACPDQAEPKPNDRGGGHPSQKKISVDKSRLWRGFNVKSPRAERWEEAAEVEEQQELQRRAGRSQSLRYDTSGSAELMGQGRRSWDTHNIENAVYHDDEWAVYKRSGYANMRPRTSGAFAPPACCSSLLGRSLSMRDTRMGLVMECASCGAALHGAGGCLLCFCSCCAAARASSTQGGMAMPTKKKGGILRACRRLLGLGKKGSAHTQM